MGTHWPEPHEKCLTGPFPQGLQPPTLQGPRMPPPHLGGRLTSSDCRTACRAIQAVPTMVSQISPLFQTSTVRPRSRRLISLRGRKRTQPLMFVHLRQGGLIPRGLGWEGLKTLGSAPARRGMLLPGNTQPLSKGAQRPFRPSGTLRGPSSALPQGHIPGCEAPAQAPRTSLQASLTPRGCSVSGSQTQDRRTSTPLQKGNLYPAQGS